MLRKILVFVCFLIFFFFLPQGVTAQTNNYSKYISNQGYIIKNFASKIEVEADTSLLITETIQASFSVQKHGIIRVIPYIYSFGGRSINGRMEMVSITDEKGQPYKYTESILNQSKKLQIGDANIFVNGDKTYVIKYRMRNVVLKYNNIPEVYWNVTGHEWDTVIVSAVAEVTSKNAEITKVKCFEGPVGSTSECKGDFSKDSAVFITSDPVLPGNDFTIVVGFSDNNSLTFPAPITKVQDNWGYFPALFPLAFIGIIWFLRGRDKKYAGDNIYYKPEKPLEKTVSIFERKFLPMVYSPINGLSPSEVGAIIDETVNIEDVIAEIIELARLKFIKIIKVKEKKLFSEAEYAFIKQKDWKDTDINDYQKAILDKIFGATDKIGKKNEEILVGLGVDPKDPNRPVVLLSFLKEYFYEALPDIKKKLYDGLKNKGIFAANPDSVRKAWFFGYVLFSFVLGFITFIYSISTFNFGPLAAGFTAFIVGIPFALSMPRKTAWGYSLSRQIVGLKEYLKVGKWREEYKEKKLFFDEMLPLAISLGVVEKLASDMKDLGIEPPSYFGNTSSTSFSTDILSFQRGISYALVVGPSGNTKWSGSSSWSGHSSWSGGSGFSGGGGSSGGGFGGGGGGSW
jgi:uncharacterized membrane protein YgcG